MTNPASEPDPLDALAEAFLEQHRQGLSPSVADYAGRHPGLAERIRELFPALLALEGLLPEEAPAPPPAERKAPERLGDYRLLRELGRGGMGVVYEAVHEALGRHVALKVLPFNELADPVHLERFKREARAAARLHHTNIVPVFDVGQHGGVHYYAMQFIRGQSLDAVLREVRRLRVSPGPGDRTPPPDGALTLPAGSSAARREGPGGAAAQPATDSGLSHQPHSHYFRGVAQLGVQAAEALDYAHGHGILHRDVKPANLLLDAEGTVWVADFGLAKFTDGEELTGTGEVVGTLRFMAPERFRGQADARSDVYSLGVTLYEMLTLCPAFHAADRAGLIERILHDEPVPPRRLDRRIPRDLEVIVLKAMAREPERRYASAADLTKDLRRFLNDEPVQARRPSAWYRFRKFARRNRAAVLTAASVALGLLVALASLSSAVLVQAASTDRIKKEHEQTNEALGREKQANDTLLRILYFRRIALAERELAGNNVGRAEELLEECPLRLRGWEWHYLKRRPYGPLTFRARSRMVFSPDGKYLAWVSDRGEITLGERATGWKVGRLLGHAKGAIRLAFSPDGKRLASAGWDRTVRVWDVAAGKEVRSLSGHSDAVASLTFSPDGKFLASASWDHTVIVWDAATFQQVRTLRGHTRGVNGIAFAAGRLASASSDGTVRIWDVNTGQELHALRGHTGPVMDVAFSREGRLASAGFDGSVKLWDAAAGQHRATIRADITPLFGVAFSPDGQRLAAGGLDRSIRIWDSETREEALTLRGHDDMVVHITFSPDGQQIASVSKGGTAKVWDASPSAAGPRALTLRGHGSAALAVAFLPDGQHLASAGNDETVRLWNATTGEQLAMLRGRAGPVVGLAVSRDGRSLASTSFAGVVQLWDVPSRKKVREFRGFAASVALSPDGTRVASASVEGWVYVWDATTGKEEIPPFRGHSSSVVGLAFSPDGKRLATTSMDGTAKVWDATTGRFLHDLKGHSNIVHSITFDGDGKRLATASWDRTAKVWDAATGKELLTLRGHDDRVLGVAFSPDGKRLATASWDSTARVWDVATGQALATLCGHTGFVFGVAFSPDGKRLASAGGYRSQGEVLIWDATQWAAKPGR